MKKYAMNASILIVEDDKITSAILSKYLKEAGYTNIYIASNVKECFAIIDKNIIDVILMDINLEEENEGIYAAQKIHRKYSVPIIYVTGNQAEQTLQLAKLTEPYAYLIKPINQKELFSSIEIALFKHKAENDLKLERDKLSIVTNSVGVALSTISKSHKITWSNDVYKNLFGSCDIDNRKKKNLKIIDMVLNGETEWVEEEMKICNRKGKNVWVQIIVTPILDETKKVKEALEVIIPISDKKRMEESLRENKEIQGLTAHLEKVREEEKTMISREIHDELGQALTALKFDVAWLNRRLKPLINDERISGVQDKLSTMVEMLNSTLKSMRRITSDLRPGILDDLGLVASIEWYLNEFINRTAISCELNIGVKEILLNDVNKTAFYRIVQEILTNIARHSKATKMSFNLTENKNKYCLVVSDNGVGIPKDKKRSLDSFGLIGIKERCLLLGGTFRMKSEEGKGTTITIRVPKSNNIK